MRATVQGRHLAAAMKHSIAARTGTMPVLQHALIEAEGAFVSITTSDLETYCTTTLPAQVDEPGNVLADAAKLGAAAAAGTELRMDELTDAVLRVRGAGRNMLRIDTLPWRDFPKPDEEQWQPLEIAPHALRAAIEAVAYAAPTQDVRYYLNTVHIRAGYVETADGKQIARAPYDHAGKPLLIPIGRALQVARLLGDGSTAAVAYAKDGSARMLRVSTVGAADGVSVSLTVLLVGGAYPDLDGTLRSLAKPECALTVDRAELQRAVRTVQSFSDYRVEKVPIAALLCDEAGFRIASRDGSEMAVPSASDQEGTMRFGARLDMLAKAIAADDTETVRLTLARQGHSGALMLQSGDGPVHITVECTLWAG